MDNLGAEHDPDVQRSSPDSDCDVGRAAAADPGTPSLPALAPPQSLLQYLQNHLPPELYAVPDEGVPQAQLPHPLPHIVNVAPAYSSRMSAGNGHGAARERRQPQTFLRHAGTSLARSLSLDESPPSHGAESSVASVSTPRSPSTHPRVQWSQGPSIPATRYHITPDDASLALESVREQRTQWLQHQMEEVEYAKTGVGDSTTSEHGSFAPPPQGQRLEDLLQQMRAEAACAPFGADSFSQSQAPSDIEWLHNDAHVPELPKVARVRSTLAWGADGSASSLDARGTEAAAVDVRQRPQSRRRHFPRKNILILPAEVLRIVFDRYLAIYFLRSLRLVCRHFDAILQANCVLWHRYLPSMFEAGAPEHVLPLCKVFTTVQRVRSGIGPPSELMTAFCFRRCCYHVWSENARLAHQRRLRERIIDEERGYAFAVCRALFFPAEGNSCAGVLMMGAAFALLSVFSIALYLDAFEPTLSFIPLWTFFLLLYPVIYYFYRCSSIEPIVLAIIVTIGFNLSALLIFFYRVQGVHMTWVGCMTPAMLCIACSATYTFILWRRFAQSSMHSKFIVGLAAVTTFIPIFMLVFLILLGSELDGALVVPQPPPSSPPPPFTLAPVSMSPSPAPYPSSPAPTPSPGQPPSPAQESACLPPVAGDIRVSGLPLLFIAAILVANIGFALRNIGFADLLVDESVPTMAVLGFAGSGVSGMALGLMHLANATSCQLFTALLSTMSLFFTSAMLSAAVGREHASHYRHLLFPTVEFM